MDIQKGLDRTMRFAKPSNGSPNPPEINLAAFDYVAEDRALS
ncbi:MAG: hypothetical protein ACR2HJ_09165 [Fimbriimonadales bacterium]